MTNHGPATPEKINSDVKLWTPCCDPPSRRLNIEPEMGCLHIIINTTKLIRIFFLEYPNVILAEKDTTLRLRY